MLPKKMIKQKKKPLKTSFVLDSLCVFLIFSPFFSVDCAIFLSFWRVEKRDKIFSLETL